MIRLGQRFLFLGYGAVAQCTLPLLLRHVQVTPKNITVMDFVDRRDVLAPLLKRGVSFVKKRITAQNLAKELGRHLRAGDVLVDLAWNIDACAILQWCHDHGVLYVNTSVELWDPYEGARDKHPTERTLYWRHMRIRAMAQQWSEPGPTAVLEHGANPGLISHFTKQGLLDIAKKALATRKFQGVQADEIRTLAKAQEFAQLAWKLGVKVIHCSERDTQISDQPKQIGEFVNTWSVEGFYEEGSTTAELGWGTHEKELPPLAHQHQDGPRNQICLARMGMNTWVVSWVPDYPIHGMVVRHGEAFTISDRLTVWDQGRAVYRPTVHYAYCPSDAAIASLHELRGNDYKLQSRHRIMRDEIIGGADILGALIMGHPFQSWWIGSMLTIEESRRLLPHQNATTMQVAISVVAAICWMIDNPARGIVVPDDLPHEQILRIAKPYLGKVVSKPSDWTPLRHYTNAFLGHNSPAIDWDDPWQFKNFLVTDGD